MAGKNMPKNKNEERLQKANKDK